MSVTMKALCECGCGNPAPLAQRTNARLGHFRGKALRFLPGHNSRNSTNLSRYVEVDRGFRTPCHEWLGPLNRKGYGYVQVTGTRKNAMRAAYERKHGQLPRDLHVDHLCRNKPCINPDHGEAVSASINNARKFSPVWISRAALKPTVEALQASALQLVERMCALTDQQNTENAA